MWSVRRQLTPPLISYQWTFYNGSQRQNEAEALFFQFQDHLNWLAQAPGGLPGLRVMQHFQYLPPAGFLPLNTSYSPGIDQDLFLTETRSSGPTSIDGSMLQTMLQAALKYPPIDLASEELRLDSSELIRLFQVWQNQRLQRPNSGPRPYLFFTTGFIHPPEEAFLNIARFNYSNYNNP